MFGCWSRLRCVWCDCRACAVWRTCRNAGLLLFSVVGVESVFLFGLFSGGDSVVFVFESAEWYLLPADFNDCLPFLEFFVPVDADCSGSVIAGFWLVFGVDRLRYVAEVVDSVVEFVLVFVVDGVRRPVSVNDEPDDYMGIVRDSVDSDVSVALGCCSSGDVSLFCVSGPVLFPDEVFAVVVQKFSGTFSG